MSLSIAVMTGARNNLRLVLLGAASSLALAALTSGGRATPFFCDNDANFNFTCGANASTSNSTASTAVGDGADAVYFLAAH